MLSSIARRSISTLAKKPVMAYSGTVLRSFSAYRPPQQHRMFAAEKVPEEDYYDGHLMTEHLEYLDDMLDKTIEIEKSLDDLKETYSQKRSEYENAGLLESSEELEQLLDQAAAQKANISIQLTNLKTIMLNAHATAIDAPDGTSDAELRDGYQEVNKIIEHAAKYEDKDMVNKKHAIEEKIQKERARDPEHDW
jgi:hypothetical protein